MIARTSASSELELLRCSAASSSEIGSTAGAVMSCRDILGILEIGLVLARLLAGGDRLRVVVGDLRSDHECGRDVLLEMRTGVRLEHLVSFPSLVDEQPNLDAVFRSCHVEESFQVVRKKGAGEPTPKAHTPRRR
jgi:hypothetical protein